MGGAPDTHTTTSPTRPDIPDELKPLVRMAVQGTTDAMPGIPLSGFTGAHPQRIPNLNDAQMQLINSMVASPFQMQGALQGRPGSVQGPAPMPTLPTWMSQAPPGYTGPPPPPPQMQGPPPPLPEMPFQVDPNTGEIIVPTAPDGGGSL
jgi:hypothetical protein